MSITPSVRLCKDETANLLVVEGKDDCHGIYQIAARKGLDQSFGIWEGGNDTGALERFGGLLLSSRKRPEIMGIVLDCDADDSGNSDAIARRWAQIQYRLIGMPYVVPSVPDSGGTIIQGPEGYPRIGVWLMPDNRAEGMFEDFLLPLIPAQALTFARETARDAKVRGYGSYKEVHESKAVAHTYLAWQDEPGKPLGIAIKAGMFDLESPRASGFIGWLRDLFQPSSG
jgi:hypothetical protein